MKANRSAKTTSEPSSSPDSRLRLRLPGMGHTYLSGPMLFGMLAPAHFGAMQWQMFLIAVALGLIAIHHSIKASGKVGTSV